MLPINYKTTVGNCTKQQPGETISGDKKLPDIYLLRNLRSYLLRKSLAPSASHCSRGIAGGNFPIVPL